MKDDELVLFFPRPVGEDAASFLLVMFAAIAGMAMCGGIGRPSLLALRDNPAGRCLRRTKDSSKNTSECAAALVAAHPVSLCERRWRQPDGWLRL